MEIIHAKRLTREEFLLLFEEGVRGPLNTMIDRPTTLGVVCYEVTDRASRYFGARTAVAYGPASACHTLVAMLVRCLGDTTERHQYPVAYYQKPHIWKLPTQER